MINFSSLIMLQMSVSLLTEDCTQLKNFFIYRIQLKFIFFKTFILPYFDYCISLTINFHNTAIRKLCKLLIVILLMI